MHVGAPGRARADPSVNLSRARREYGPRGHAVAVPPPALLNPDPWDWLVPFDAALFADTLPRETGGPLLVRLWKAANYLDIPGLAAVLVAIGAAHLRGETSESIASLFKWHAPYSEAEKEEIYAANSWMLAPLDI